jgi:acyl carrier protein
MTLSSLSPTQRAAPQVDFDTNKVRTLIAEYLGIDAKRVTNEAHFSEDLGLDWLDQLGLMILIEDEFAGVEFSDTAANQIEVVSDVIRHIEITNKAQSVKNHQNAGPVLRRKVFGADDILHLRRP